MAKTAADGIVAKKRKIEIVSGEDAPIYYANNISIDLSSFDVRFRLGQIQGATDAAVQVMQVAQVFMSHSHFRAFVAAVNTTAKKLDDLPAPVLDVAIAEH